jgi:hypothetical protein
MVPLSSVTDFRAAILYFLRFYTLLARKSS